MGYFSSRPATKATYTKAAILLLAASINWLALYSQTFKEKFESGIKDDYWATEGLKSVTSSDYSVSGKKAYRSYIPLKVHSNPRCEIRFRGANGTPNWHPHFSTWGVKFAIYIPKDFQPDPTSNEYLAQFHSVPDRGDTYNNPPWALRLRGTRLSVTNRWIEKKIASNSHQHEKTWSIPGNVVPGKWHYFIVDIHWDYRSGGNGFMKFYMKVGSPPGNSDLKVKHNGPTGYNDNKGAYFKLGLYKWDWKTQMRVNWSKSAGVKYREVYYDDFEIKKNGFGPAANIEKPPVADAGSDKTVTLPTNKIVLKGSGSDPDGTIKKYRWIQESGPSDATLDNENTRNLEVTKLKKGVYTFRLTVEDNDGLKDSDDVKVTVEEPENQPPTAKAGPDITITLPTNSVDIEGTGTDPDDNIKSYKWVQKSGPSNATLKDDDKPTVKISKLKEGRYAFELSVIDEEGEVDRDRVVVNVEPPVNQAPTAKAGPDITITLPTNSVNIEGTGTDPDDNIKSYRWVQKSGPSNATLSDDDKSTVKISKLKEGRYAFELSVIDEEGEVDRDRVVVYVEPPVNQPPTAKAGPDINIMLPTSTVTIEGKGTDPDGDIDSFQWEQKSGPSDADLKGASTSKLTASNLVEGKYAFELTVTDEFGDEDSDRVIVIVGIPDNLPPSADAGTNLTVTMPNTTVTIKGKGTDQDDGIASYQWSQVSGPSDANLIDPAKPTTEVTNLELGQYKFKLQVTDKTGESDSDQVVVTVVEAQPTISADITNASCNSSDGAIALSIEGGRAPFTYSWSNGASGNEIEDLSAGTYQVDVTDNLGRSISKSFTVENQEADLKVTSEVKDATCGNENGSIKVEVSGGTGPYNFDWSNNGRSASLNKLTAGSYTLIVSDQNGCSKKASFEVGIDPAAMALEVNSEINGASCKGNDGSIALSVPGYNEPLSFNWDHGVSGPTLNNLAAGTYKVTISDVHGCFMKSDYVVEQSNNPKKPIISQLGDSLIVNLKNMQYQWYRDGKIITNSTQQVLKITEGGRYSVAVTNDNACSTNSDYFFADDPFTPLAGNTVIRQVEFYPNPATSDINIRLYLAEPVETELTIYDFVGRIVKTQSLGMVSSQTHSLSVRELPSGTYLLRAKADNEIVTRRFIKH